MSRAVYFIGGPGTGKSTAARALLDGVRLQPAAPVDGTHRLLVGQLFVDGSGVYLGKRGGRFPGTDRLSMAVAPQATRWAANGALPDVIVGEGSRLGTFGFLSTLAVRCDLLVVLLRADADVVAARYAARGSEQDEAWVRGRFKAAENAARRLRDAGTNVAPIDTTTRPPEAVASVARTHLRLDEREIPRNEENNEGRSAM